MDVRRVVVESPAIKFEIVPGEGEMEEGVKLPGKGHIRIGHEFGAGDGARE